MLASKVATEAGERHEGLKGRMSEADAAVAEAERLLNEAKQQRAEVARELDEAGGELESAKKQEEELARRRQTAQSEEVRLQRIREQSQLDEQKMTEETQAEEEETSRRAELAESIWKMKELHAQEENDQQPRDSDSTGDGRGRSNSDKDQGIGEEEKRQRAYEAASAKERARCKQRDQLSRTCQVSWGPKHAINKFKVVSFEFDEIKFGDVQPLTFESVPWPDLRHPDELKFEHIDWSSVETFFSELRASVGASEYKELVVKAHRRFHPDKWRARALFSTVLDDDLRDKLEAAVLVVSQSLTPLWRECK
ncbi:uncharacterized protein PHACADRAFT_159957 [Phanerochaete carnosa HHB-10118-sp]|uniref:Uncharacterized protein n=1 Tax=Phanerochaete carnosa (strain HHB-10118-sp) TaxID=650164 RepID=K5WB22_PHACS|nr:uncharacterized protein PHACADRAFT_159957 [Phanerochaete carnosa HHB-10118-sp]EKM56395.1 hypothetical protein PHACADRAFT_159957 [Phanerochaete carnosa HHB-10118-sp]